MERRGRRERQLLAIIDSIAQEMDLPIRFERIRIVKRGSARIGSRM